ncbi:MAG: solute carrier family 23 protein [Candidatus Wallbacteria bacterium]
MAKRPQNLIYSANEAPSFFTALALALQHVIGLPSMVILPVVIIKEAGGTIDQIQPLIQMSLIAGGIGVILQSLSSKYIGSGFLCPQNTGANYITASVLAVKTGGLSLLFGMTLIAGLIQASFALAVKRLRTWFPAEVTGLTVLMVGLSLIKISISRFFGLTASGTVAGWRSLLVAALSLALMSSISIFSKKKLRLYSLLIGAAAGYITAFILGLINLEDIEKFRSAPLFSVPRISYSYSFDFSLVIPFMVAAVVSTLKTFGDITTCQKINDTDWKKPDISNISRGILADACGTISAGLLGGTGQASSSSNIGLALATGATSRYIGFYCGAILILLSFFPKLAALFSIMPQPVMGAALIYVVCFTIVTGIQMISTKILDIRKIFVIGFSITAGLSVDMLPEIYRAFSMPAWLNPLFASSLSLAAVTAIILNLIFKIGKTNIFETKISPYTDNYYQIRDFMSELEMVWSVRDDVIYRAISALEEFFETAARLKLAKNDILLKVTYDEFNLDIVIIYKGELIMFYDSMPAKEEAASDLNYASRLSGYLIKTYTDRAECRSDDGICFVKLHFIH